MSVMKGSLAKAVEELRHAAEAPAAQRGEDWKRRVEQALASVERAARRHGAALGDGDGRTVDVETSLNPSPTVARRTDQLRRQLDDLLHEAESLRRKVRGVHPAADIDPAGAAGALSVAPEAADVADFGVFCERVEQLLAGFEQMEEEETVLVQDSVNLDLGAGD